MDFFNQLPSNPWAWLFIAVITIGGVILAYRSTPQKVLKCIISSNALITKKQSVISKLSILYDGKDVDNLTVSKIKFWNNSFPTINKTDLIDAAPFSILVNDGEILNVSVLQGDNTPNRINVVLKDNNAAQIVFDYIDKKEGGIIQIIHTGDENSIDVSRKIKGGKIIVVSKIGRLLVTCVEFVVSIVFLYSCAYLSTIGLSPSDDIHNWVYTIVIVLTYIFILWRMGHTEFIPKNCKKQH